MDPLDLANALATELDSFGRRRPVTVAVDGPDGSGRSTLADRLATACRSRGRSVVRIDEDDFLQPHRIRYRRGSEAPEGFLEDTFDYAALRHLVLEPLAAGGHHIVTRVRDPETDNAVEEPAVHVPDDVVLIVDGPFLLRKSLRGYWTIGVLLEKREGERTDGCPDHSAAAGRSGRRARGFALYLEQDDPAAVADILIDTTDARRPVPIRWR